MASVTNITGTKRTRADSDDLVREDEVLKKKKGDESASTNSYFHQGLKSLARYIQEATPPLLEHAVACFSIALEQIGPDSPLYQEVLKVRDMAKKINLGDDIPSEIDPEEVYWPTERDEIQIKKELGTYYLEEGAKHLQKAMMARKSERQGLALQAIDHFKVAEKLLGSTHPALVGCKKFIKMRLTEWGNES